MTLALPGVFLEHQFEAKQIQIVQKNATIFIDGNHLFRDEFTNQVILPNELQLTKTPPIFQNRNHFGVNFKKRWVLKLCKQF